MSRARTMSRYSTRFAAEAKSFGASLLASSAFYLLQRMVFGAMPTFGIIDLLGVVVSYAVFTVVFEHPHMLERVRRSWQWPSESPLSRSRHLDFDLLEQELLKLRSEIAGISSEAVHRRELLRVARFEILGELITGFQHELNDYFTIALGNVDLLRNPATDNQTKLTAVDKIAHAIGNASLKVRRTMSLFEDVAIEREEVLSVKELVAEAIDMASGVWRTRAEVTGRSVSLEVDLDEGFILADRNECRQVLLNLIVNAVDAMPFGGTISIRSSRSPEAVKISIADTGIGISPGAVSRVFEPFFTTKVAAAGLGLTLAKAIVERRGGRIECSSTAGQGTVFSVTLPSVDRPSAHADPGPGGLVVTTTAQRGEVVVVDDNVDVVQAITGNLKLAGFDVTGFSSSQEALTYIVKSAERIALLITDLSMPGMTGTVLAQKVRRVAPHIRIALLSGFHVQEALRSRDSEVSNFDTFITKPVDPEKLFSIVRDFVR